MSRNITQPPVICNSSPLIYQWPLEYHHHWYTSDSLKVTIYQWPARNTSPTPSPHQWYKLSKNTMKHQVNQVTTFTILFRTLLTNPQLQRDMIQYRWTKPQISYEVLYSSLLTMVTDLLMNSENLPTVSVTPYITRLLNKVLAHNTEV